MPDAVHKPNVVKGRLIIEGLVDLNQPFDTDELVLFVAATCNGAPFTGSFAVKPAWVEALPDDG